MNGSPRNVLVDAGTLLAAASGAVFVCRDAGVALSPYSAVYVVSVLIVVRVLSLGVHELGHLVAAALGGWRWDVYKVGPLLLSRETGPLTVSLRGGRRFKAAGLVLTHPPSAESDTRARHVLMLIGGPAASAVFSVFVGLWWQAVDVPPVRVALGIASVFSAIVFVTTVLPFVSSGNPSDGATILALWREHNEAPRTGHAR